MKGEGEEEWRRNGREGGWNGEEKSGMIGRSGSRKGGRDDGRKLGRGGG